MSGSSPSQSLDQRQFEQLFKANFEPLCRFARQYVPDRDVAQDICQKVFVRMWEKRQDMDPDGSLVSYLFTAVKNRCLNYIRDHKKYRSELLDVECGDIEIGITEDHFGLEELQMRIEQALATLPPKCRMVFEMSRYQELRYQDIAAKLEISPKTVEAHMSKAIRTLREELEDYLCLLFLLKCGISPEVVETLLRRWL